MDVFPVSARGLTWGSIPVSANTNGMNTFALDQYTEARYFWLTGSGVFSESKQIACVQPLTQGLY